MAFRLSYLCFVSKNLEVSTIESVMQATRTKAIQSEFRKKSNTDCSAQCSSTVSEPNIKEKKSKRSDPTTIEIFFCVCVCEKTKALRKDGRTSGYESLAELQAFEASKTLKDAAEIRNDASVLLVIKDKGSIALEVKCHKSCFKDYTNAKNLDRIKIKNEQENEKMSIYDKAFERIVKIVKDAMVDGSAIARISEL